MPFFSSLSPLHHFTSYLSFTLSVMAKAFSSLTDLYARDNTSTTNSSSSSSSSRPIANTISNAAIPPSPRGAKVVVLDNGCMCCSVRGDLLGAFSSVLERMEESKAKEVGDTAQGQVKILDSVLVETTGMADPVPIVRTLLQVLSNPGIGTIFPLFST